MYWSQNLSEPQVRSEYLIDSHGNECYKVWVGGLHTYVSSTHLITSAVNRLISRRDSKIKALVDSYVEYHGWNPNTQPAADLYPEAVKHYGWFEAAGLL